MSNNVNRVETSLPQITTNEFFENNSDNIIQITESKARLTYKKYSKRSTKNDILTYLGLFLAFLVPLITSDFRDFFFISASSICSIFILVSAYFVYKIIRSVIDYFGNDRYLTEDNFIQELKGEERTDIKNRNEALKHKIKEAYSQGYQDGVSKTISRYVSSKIIHKNIKRK